MILETEVMILYEGGKFYCQFEIFSGSRQCVYYLNELGLFVPKHLTYFDTKEEIMKLLGEANVLTNCNG
jgi:hypothetical protein